MRSAAAAGVTRTESTSSEPTICTDTATARPSSSMKTMDRATVGTPRASATCASMLANISGRQTSSSATTTIAADDQQRGQPGVVHGDDLAGQQPELVGRAAGVERQAEDPEAQPEGHQHGDDRVPVAGAAAQHADEQGGRERAGQGALDDPDPEQQPGGRAGEGQLADRVHGEGQVAGHDEDADQAAGEAEHRAGDDRVADQDEQLAVVVELEELRPQRRPRASCISGRSRRGAVRARGPRSAWSGSPTTMIRPRARMTSTGVS